MTTQRSRTLLNGTGWCQRNKLIALSLRESVSCIRSLSLVSETSRYSEYRAKKEKEHSDWLERKKERDEKISRGEEVGPEEPDPTEEPEVGCLGLLKFILYFTIFVLLAGKFFTGSFLWEQQLPSLRQFLPVRRSTTSMMFA